MKKIRTLIELQSALDEDFSWRLKEIASLKSAARRPESLTEVTIVRAGIALAYAHWEGFVKFATSSYLSYVGNTGATHHQLVTCLAVVSLHGKIQTLIEANSGVASSNAFEFIRDQLSEKAHFTGKNVVSTGSNLSSTTLRKILDAVGIDVTRYEPRFNFIDQTLLRNRHAVAHGDALSLDSLGWATVAEDTITLLRWIKDDVENAASTKAFRRPEAATRGAA